MFFNGTRGTQFVVYAILKAESKSSTYNYAVHSCE